MITKVTTRGGKYYGTVRDGDRIVYATPGYYTAGMARADVTCWLAFHGGSAMNKHVPVAVEFVYFTTVADGSTQQRQTASLDCEVPEGLSNHNIAIRAWRLLTRNWEKSGVFMTAHVRHLHPLT